MHFRLAQILCLGIAAISCGCSDDEPSSSRIPASAVYDFVTIDSSSSKGSVFTMQKSGDSPLITYYAPVDLTKVEELTKGDRIILCYNRTDGETYTNGNIDVYGYVLPANTSKTAVSDSEAQAVGFECPPMKVNALWRTGQFINVDTELSVFKAIRPQTFILAADTTTLNDDVPKLHLYYRNAADNDGYSPFTVYGSFDILDIWKHSDCKGVEVLYLTSTGEESQVFLKK